MFLKTYLSQNISALLAQICVDRGRHHSSGKYRTIYMYRYMNTFDLIRLSSKVLNPARILFRGGSSKYDEF